MKSERRHELQRNTLEVEIRKVWEFLRLRGNLLGGIALAAAAIVLGIVFFVSRSHGEAESIQAKFALLVLSPASEDRSAGLEEIAQKTSYPLWASMADVTLGDDAALRMMAEWPTLSDADRASLRDKARGYYQKAISEFPKEEVAVARAHYGLGKLAEDWGDLPAAKKEYEAVMQMDQSLRGQSILYLAQGALTQLAQFQGTVYMPATAPSTGPSTQATQPLSAPASGPAGATSLPAPAASRPAGAAAIPAATPAATTAPARVAPTAATGPATATPASGTGAKSD
jgi:hypothetical protein